MASVRMKDIADDLGVSISTVSRALKNGSAGNGERREDVWRAARKLGYRPPSASGRPKGVGTIALVAIGVPGRARVDELSRLSYPGASFYGEFVWGVEHAVRKLGGELRIHNIERGPDLIERGCQAIDSMKADGTIVLGGFGSTDVRPLAQGRAVVLLNAPRAMVGADTVVADDQGGVYRAVERMAQLGHERIAFWVDRDKDGVLEPLSRERLSGYRAAVEDLGLSYERTYCEAQGDKAYIERMEEGFEAFLEDSERPTAIVASVDLHACALLRLAHAHGIGVPEELSIFGFDDVVMSAHTYPSLSTVSANRQLMGREAVELLTRRMGEPHGPFRRVTLQCRLVERESSGPAGPARCSMVNEGSHAAV